MSKEILITGGTGMMGRHIDWGLTRRGFSVDISSSVEAETSPQDGIYRVNLGNQDDINKVVAGGYKAIFNMAGLADPRICRDNPDLTDKINHQAVIQLLEAVKKLPDNKRPIVVLACSVLQFNISRSGTFGPESELKQTDDPYTKSKNDMFYSALPYLSEGVDVRFAFIANTTGEGHQLGYFPTDMAHQILTKEKVIHGPIGHQRPFLHGQDAAEIFFYGLTKLSTGSRFLVAGSESVRLSDFLSKMIELSGKSPKTEESNSVGGKATIENIEFDISQLTRLGYRQVRGVEDICRTLLMDRARVLRGEPLPTRGINGY